jgi:hypothetical protein
MMYMVSHQDFEAIRSRVGVWIEDRKELIAAVAQKLLLKQKMSGEELRHAMEAFHQKYPHFAVLARL